MVDESSLASTRQVRDFLRRIDPSDRLLFIGDVRQHQGVEAGKPFEQLVKAGMKTAHLDQIVRQKGPELLRAVEHLSRGEVAEGVALLVHQSRVTEIANPQRRIAALARCYATHPESIIVVSPDNAYCLRRSGREGHRTRMGRSHRAVVADFGRDNFSI
jgi:hypothetical protein